MSVSDIVKHCQNMHEMQNLPFFQCEKCDYVSEKYSKTREHMKNEHNVVEYKPYKCTHCEVQSDGTNFVKHVQNHKQSFICDICGAALSSKGGLSRHKTSFHTEGLQDHVCDICGFTSKQIKNLQRHIRNVHLKPEKCEFCEKSYGTKELLVYHMDSAHPGTAELKYFCATCGKGFMYKNSLSVRCFKNIGCSKGKKLGGKKTGLVKTEDIKPDAPVSCQYCRNEYTRKTITSHYRRSHPEKYFTADMKRKEYKCPNCEEKYYTPNSK